MSNRNEHNIMTRKGDGAMKMNLRIEADDKNELFTWKLWGRGLMLDTAREYRLVERAVKAAKRVAKQLNIEISRCEYYEPKTGYEQPMEI